METREYTKEEMEQSIKRFHALDNDVRDRILNAALHEFSYGFKKASTDIIVREAGISKGFLFKCFLTKENLYDFMVDFAQETVGENYFDMINLGQRDILESFWQMAVLKKEIYYRYPSIIDFLEGVYRHMADCPNVKVKTLFFEKEKQIFDELCNRCDTSKFRDDIDPIKAIEFLWWGFIGLQMESSRIANNKQLDTPVFAKYLEGLRIYVDMCRTCFYK